MSFYQLPPELLCAILSHLSSDELKGLQALHACALTCRALVAPAQANIFQSVLLSFEARSARSVLAKLESTPHIRTFIKHLCLLEIHKPWIQHSQVFQDILCFLSPYVISLSIKQRRRKTESPRFDPSSLAQLKSLEKISLVEDQVLGPETTKNGDKALPTFLNHFPRLREITFEGCWVRNETIDCIGDIAAPIFRLETLDIWHCDDALALDWLLPALSLLRKLHFAYPSSISGTNVARFMIKAGETLQHLQVALIGDSLDDTANADLETLMNAVRMYASDLRSLSLVVTGATYVHSPSPILVFAQALLLLGAHVHLQHLAIGLSEYDARENGRTSRLHGSQWDEFQDLLLGTRFPALRSVEFRVLMGSPDSLPIAIEPLIAVVPRLAQKGIISVRLIHGGL